MKIIHCNDTKSLAEKISSHIGLKIVKREISKFSDGEISIKIYDDLYQNDVLITHQLFPNVNDNLMQLFFLISAIKKRGSKKVHVIAPYLAYSRMDHKKVYNDFISASCLASLLEASGLDTLITVDLHSSQIEGFFRIPVKNITMVKLFGAIFKDIKNTESVIVSPDIGGRIRSINVAKLLNMPCAILCKQRDEQNNISISGIMGIVKDKHCIVLDDIIGSGQTIMTAINTLESAKARSIEVIATHCLLAVSDIGILSNIAKKVSKLTISNSIQCNDKLLYSLKIRTVDISEAIIDCINLCF